MKENNSVSRPLALSIVAVCSFVVGLIGTLAGVLLVLFLIQPIQPPNVSASFISNATFLTLLWIVLGPILVYSSYNLFRMKKWAAQTIAIIMLFDLVASPLYRVISQSGIGATNLLGWLIDIVMLLLLAYARDAAFVR